jgi:Sulfotransferase family
MSSSSGWLPPARSREALAIYAAAEAERAAKPERFRLGAEAVDATIERALRGRDPACLGDPAEWRGGLEQYLASAAEDGRLNAVGARMVLGTASAKLAARAKLADLAQSDPSIEQRSLAPPIVIVGGWRTGTTFLFRLLATDPRLRAPLPAELTAPWRIAGRSAADREAVIDASAAAHDLLHVLNPRLAAVHDSGPRLPEECVLAMGTDLRNWGFSSTVRLESYSRWLAGEDLGPSYRAYRRILQLLDAGDRRWLLKAPAHTAELAHLAATFPGACIVFLHRDIVETVASGASLFATFRSTYSDEVDPVDVGRFLTEQTELWLRRAERFRASDVARAVTVVDLEYTDLVRDTPAALRRIYGAAGLEALDDLEALVQRHHAAAPRTAKGAHAYDPVDFGLDAAELRERFAAQPK